MAKKDLQFSVDVNGDISGLKKAMNEAEALMKQTAQSIKNIDTAIASDPNDINLLKKQQELYRIEITETRKSIRKLKKIQDEIANDEKYKKGITEYTAKYTELEKEIKRLNAEEKRLIKEQNDLNLKVSNFTFDVKMRKVTEALKKASEATEKVKRSLANIDDQIKLDPYNVELYSQKQELLKNKLEKVNEELKVLEREKKLLEDPRFRIETEEDARALEVNALKTKELADEKKRLENVIRNQLSPTMEAFAKRTQELSTSLGDVASKTYRMSAFFKTLLTESFNASKSYETNIAKIEKVTGELSDTLINDLKNMAIETGRTFEEISEYATISGALGLAGEEITEFTKAMVDLNAVSGGAFSGEEGAKGIAVFLKQLNLTTDEAENFASAIAVLGDRYADIGDETVHVATRLTGLTSIIKTNQYELLGLSGVMADLGLSSDSNANAINRAFLQIDKALNDTSKNGQKKLKALSDASGMSAKAFKKAWEEDALDAFLRFTDGLKNSTFNEINDAIDKSTSKVKDFANVLGVSQEEFVYMWQKDSKGVYEQLVEMLGEVSDDGIVASQVLTDLGISSVNTAQTLLRLSGSGNEVRNAIKLANEAWTENTAIQEKTAILYNTTENKLNSMYESLNQLKASLVDTVLPTLKDGIDVITRISQEFSKLSPTMRKLILNFVAIGSAISPVTRMMSNFTGSLFKVDKETGNFIRTAGKLQLTMGGTVAIIGTVVSALAVLGGAIVDYYHSTDKYIQNQKLQEHLQSAREEMELMRTSLHESLFDWEVSNTSIRNEIQALDELYVKLKDGNLSYKERKEVKQDLLEQIDEVNKALGGTFYYWDESTQKIRNEKGEIVNSGGLIDAYKDLEIERKRAFTLEAMGDDYTEALKIEKQAVEDMIEIRKQFKDDVSTYAEIYGADFVNNAQLYASAMKEAQGDVSKITPELREWASSLNGTEMIAVNNIGKMVDETNGKLAEQNKLLEDANQIRRNYEAIEKASADEFERTVTLIQNGYDTAKIQEGLILVNEKIAECNEALEYRELLSENEIAYYEEELAKQIEIRDLYLQMADEQSTIDTELHENKMKFYDEQKKEQEENFKKMYDHHDGTLVVKFREGSETMESIWDDTTDHMRDDMKRDMEQSIDEVTDYIQSQHPNMNATVTFSYSGLSSAFNNPFAEITATMNSRGFGNLYGSALDSISRSIANMNSGGYNSRGINLTANFTINNGSNLTSREMAVTFAREFADEINNALGMQI